MKRLTKPEKLLKEQMVAILEQAAKHPRKWQGIAPELEWNRAAKLLEKRGVIDIRQQMNQFCLKPCSEGDE
jgi:hypothetical protein